MYQFTSTVDDSVLWGRLESWPARPDTDWSLILKFRIKSGALGPWDDDAPLTMLDEKIAECMLSRQNDTWIVFAALRHADKNEITPDACLRLAQTAEFEAARASGQAAATGQSATPSGVNAPGTGTARVPRTSVNSTGASSGGETAPVSSHAEPSPVAGTLWTKVVSDFASSRDKHAAAASAPDVTATSGGDSTEAGTQSGPDLCYKTCRQPLGLGAKPDMCRHRCRLPARHKSFDHLCAACLVKSQAPDRCCTGRCDEQFCRGVTETRSAGLTHFPVTGLATSCAREAGHVDEHVCAFCFAASGPASGRGRDHKARSREVLFLAGTDGDEVSAGSAHGTGSASDPAPVAGSSVDLAPSNTAGSLVASLLANAGDSPRSAGYAEATNRFRARGGGRIGSISLRPIRGGVRIGSS